MAFAVSFGLNEHANTKAMVLNNVRYQIIGEEYRENSVGPRTEP